MQYLYFCASRFNLSVKVKRNTKTWVRYFKLLQSQILKTLLSEEKINFKVSPNSAAMVSSTGLLDFCQ